MSYYDSYIPSVEYFVYRKCHPDWVIESSITDFHDLTYITSGNGIYLIDGVETPVAAGDIIYIPPYKLRQAWTSQKALMELYAINFVLTPYAGVDNNSTLPFALVNKIGYDAKVVNLFKQLSRIWMEKEDLYEIDARALTLQIISELFRRLCRNKMINQIDKRIEFVKDFINENYQLPLTVPLLAKKVGLNHVYLGALFMQNEFCSINDYVNKIRINHALEILRTEDLSIKEVAHGCGYSDAFYFSRTFKKYLGISPTQVRKNSSVPANR